MNHPLIVAGAVAVTFALNAGSTFAEDHPKTTHSISGQEGVIIEGKLVSLQAYLQKADHAASLQTGQTSAPPARPDASRTGTSAAPDKDRTESSAPAFRDQAGRQGSRLASPNADASKENSDSRESTGASHSKTLVLIARPSGIQESPAGSVRSDSTPAPAGFPRADEQSSRSSTTHANGGTAYILVFGDDSAGQAAFSKACGLTTEGTSNWSVSDGEEGDRLKVRGEDTVGSSERSGIRQAQQPFASASTNRTGQRDDPAKGSREASHVKITGKMMSRGGIQAIQVSEISTSSLQRDSASTTPGNVDRERTNQNTEKKRE